LRINKKKKIELGPEQLLVERQRRIEDTWINSFQHYYEVQQLLEQ